MRVFPAVTLGANAFEWFGGVPQCQFFRLIASTGAVNVEYFYEYNLLGEYTAENVEVGYAARLSTLFDAVKVTDVSGANNTITIGLSSGEGWYDRTSSASDSTIIRRTTAATSVVAVAITSTTLLIARGGRDICLIKNLDNLNPVHIADDTNAATTSDYYLGPGEEMVWQVQDGANAIAVSAAVNVNIADYYT